MKKNQGITGGVLAMLLAGFVVKDVSSSKPQADEPSTKARASAGKSVTPDKIEGPWIASCAYWASSSIPGTTSEKPQTPCGSKDEAWGIPSHDPHHPIEISTLIATVPDPVHSHLALDFDRTIDMLLLAASDNRYLGSYYWLPWHNHMGTPSKSGSTAEDTEGGHDENEEKIRQEQPGLIVLRYSPRLGVDDLSTAYHRVVYLFLVAETPALGVNGVQLRNALRYQQILREQHNAILAVHPSATPAAQKMSIIGPLYSGSAASLREGLEAAPLSPKPTQFEIAGVTGTTIAAQELDPAAKGDFHSFGENAGFEEDQFIKALASTGYNLSRVAVLSEAGTVFGTAAVQSMGKGQLLALRFPRELSLLRNAQATQSGQSGSAIPTPYLSLSLKDYASDDTEPRLSTTQSPLSIEAQLMAIAHQLQRSRIQFIVISASNILDDIFLAQFLHRACPNARIVTVSGGDLLFERDTENTPYIGAISISPYLLTSIGSTRGWLYSDGQSAGVYNAASFVFWDRKPEHFPFVGYVPYKRTGLNDTSLAHNTTQGADVFRMPLWAAVVGADGYYPLAVLAWCASNSASILPSISLGDGVTLLKDDVCLKADTVPPNQLSNLSAERPPASLERSSSISPSLAWGLIACAIIFMSIGHTLMLLSAQYWSPFTRDLAVNDNDQPRRRTVYISIGTCVLFCMGYITAFPLLRVNHFYATTLLGRGLAYMLLATGGAAVLATMIKTWRYLLHPDCVEFRFFTCVAAVALPSIAFAWSHICASDVSFVDPASANAGTHTFAGLFFSYRCLQPLSGVCPLLPVLLLLLAWFLWAICQVSRLRFSEMHRPRMPRFVRQQQPYEITSVPYPLYVPEEALQACARPIDGCLYENITTLLITRELLSRFCANVEKAATRFTRSIVGQAQRRLTLVLCVAYLLLFIALIMASNIRSLERFVSTPLLQGLTIRWIGAGPTLYEFLVVSLFFPLIMIAFSGWLRTILIWGALRRSLLEPLERFPLRCAFSRTEGGNWISMLSQSGLHIRWRDMSRTSEALRQIVHHPDIRDSVSVFASDLKTKYNELNWYIRLLMLRIAPTPRAGEDMAFLPLLPPPYPLDGQDKPCRDSQRDVGPYPNFTDLSLIREIEMRYAAFCQILIRDLLTRYWDHERISTVETCKGSAGPESLTSSSVGELQNAPPLIALAEELLVVRYVALIRAVLVNMRYLMIFVAAVFVLALVAWNSYPFQPHAFINWCFTIMLVIISTGFVTVFAQMHRNTILSRITDSTPNELGWDFYLRIITFGAIPLLTWLAYQFPEIGGSLYRILQPGLQIAK